MTCLDDNVLAALIDGTLEGAERAEAEAHLDRCSLCRNVLSRLMGQTESDRGKAQPNDRPASIPALATGATAGRFVLLNTVGVGGMGVVYAAFDPQLDRKVAVKILRPRAGGFDPIELRARMTGEAQALARISHPNVMAVYEVGTVDDQIFIAMEFVDGGTLADWLSSQKRTWRETVEQFSYAGRGLAAAHGAGLVHRDFKPENILIRRDGRVCVSDFGLARPLTSKESTGPLPDRIETYSSHDPLTRTGAMVGTPAYMAPEQMTGAAVDARSDQFAFCVALYEALYGERPFAGDTPGSILKEMRAGRIRPEASDRRVPIWIRRILIRGLSFDPADRFPAMESLLQALRKDPRAALRRSAAIAGLLLMGAAAGTAAFALRAKRARACRDAEARLAGIWDDDQRSSLREAFLSTGAPFAKDAWDRVQEALDKYAQRWTAMHIQACEATRVRGVQTEEVLGLRMECLDQHLRSLGALVDVLSDADAEQTEKAGQAVASLPDLGACDNVSALRARLHLPSPQIRDQVRKLRTRLAEAKALGLSGKYSDARSSLQELIKPIEALGYLPLLAEALQELGDMESRLDEAPKAEAALRSAVRIAEESGEDEIRARSLILLADLLSLHGRRLAEAEFDAEMANGVVERMGNPPLPKAFLEDRMGLLDLRLERYDRAIAHHRAALALWEKHLGPQSIDAAGSLTNIGVDLSAKGDLPGAVEHYTKAIEALKRAVGDSHPMLARAYNNISNQYQRMGQSHKAEDMVRHAIAIYEQSQSARPRSVALSFSNLGKILLERDKSREARDAFERQAQICLKAYGPNSSEVARSHWDMAVYFHETKDYKRAGENLKQALAIYRANGERGRFVGGVMRDLGVLRVTEHRYVEAQSLLEEALKILSSTLGKDNSELAHPLRMLGEAELGLHRPKEAAQSLQAALDLQPSAPSGRRSLRWCDLIWPKPFGNRSRSRRRPFPSPERHTMSSRNQSVPTRPRWFWGRFRLGSIGTLSEQR